MLAPFNGMMVVGTHEEDPNAQAATIRLWEWQSGIPLPTDTTTIMEGLPQMNTTATATNATTSADTNATATPDEEGEGDEQQQQQTTPTIPAPLLE
jgi:hypothetical protein